VSWPKYFSIRLQSSFFFIVHGATIVFFFYERHEDEGRKVSSIRMDPEPERKHLMALIHSLEETDSLEINILSSRSLWRDQQRKRRKRVVAPIRDLLREYISKESKISFINRAIPDPLSFLARD